MTYKGTLAGDPFKPDFIVGNSVILEIKAVERIHPIHEAQLLTYLQLTGVPAGLLVNFHTPLLRDGIKRYLGRLSMKSSSNHEEKNLNHEGTKGTT